MTKQTLVCPNCGEETFIRKEVIVQNVVVRGNGEVVQSAANPLTHTIFDDFICMDCNHNYTSQDQLVTEEHFHTVIVPQEEEQKVYDKEVKFRRIAESEMENIFHSDIALIEVEDEKFHVYKNKPRLNFDKLIDKEQIDDMMTSPYKVIVLYRPGSEYDSQYNFNIDE